MTRNGKIPGKSGDSSTADRHQHKCATARYLTFWEVKEGIGGNVFGSRAQLCAAHFLLSTLCLCLALYRPVVRLSGFASWTRQRGDGNRARRWVGIGFPSRASGELDWSWKVFLDSDSCLRGGVHALLGALKERIRSAQLVALRSVNLEQISLYADIGQMIVERQQGDTWVKETWGI